MKRIASLLLTAVLLATMLSVFAVPASAEGESQTDAPGITWELTENNTKLILGGKGAMPDFYKNGMEDRPWSDAISTITTVEIASGVTSIGKSAFFNFEKLSSVTIPYGVTKIGSYAFMGCKNLEYITLPSSVTSINSYAFEDCGALSSVTVPSGVTVINVGTFMNCASLKSVTIPSGVTSIEAMAFNGCTSLRSVTLPSSVTSIGMMAFYSTDLLNLTVKASKPPTLGALALPSSNADFAIYAPCGSSEAYQAANYWSDFSGNIQEAYIVDDKPAENGTITVDKDCFPTSNFGNADKTVTVTVTPDEGYQLKSLVWSDGTKDNDITDAMCFEMPSDNVTVTVVFEKIAVVTWELTENNTKLILGGNGAMPDFYKNGMEDRPWSDAISTITTVEIASGLTSIGKSAFFNFEKLSSVTIPYGVTKIGSYAFMGCKNLEYITLPSSVTSINSYAFEDCGALSSVTIPPNVTAIKAGTFMNCASLKSVTLPSGVTSIGRMAFSGCTRLTSVTLPSGVTSIGMMAFYSTGLLNLTLKASTPPTLERYAFPSSNAGFTINVPHGMGDTYRSENNWSTYSSMIQESNDVTVTAESAIGSVLSEGNIWIIIAVAVLAVGGVAALVIVKKKKAIHNA